MDCRLPCPSRTPGACSNHVHWVGDAIQTTHPLSSASPAFNLSQHQGLFQQVSSSHQVAKILEFQLQHQSFQWISLISFRMDWLDLLAVQGTLQSLSQHQSLKASIFRCSAFFIVQLSLAQQGNLWPKGNRREMLTAHWQILSGQLHPCCYLKTLGGRWSVSAQATKLLSSVLLEI